jgi:YD repeat-containing protein
LLCALKAKWTNFERGDRAARFPLQQVCREMRAMRKGPFAARFHSESSGRKLYDGTSVTATYDSLYSNPLTKTDEAGTLTRYEYDSKGNLLTMTEAVGLPEQRITTRQ